MIANRSYDCIVIGGGPGGSTAAAIVAEQGHSVLLIERDTVPFSPITMTAPATKAGM